MSELTPLEEYAKYKRMKTMGEVFINDFINELNDALLKMRIDENPRAAGEVEAEDRGFKMAIKQVRNYLGYQDEKP